MSGGKHSLIQVKFEIYKNVTSKRTVQKQLNVELSISNNPFWASQGVWQERYQNRCAPKQVCKSCFSSALQYLLHCCCFKHLL